MIVRGPIAWRAYIESILYLIKFIKVQCTLSYRVF